MVEILAADNGFGWTKGLTRRGRVLLPSLVGAAETIRFDSGITQNGHGITLEVEGQPLFVGEQAEVQSASVRQTLDGTRTGSREQKALFYGLCSELVRARDKEIAVVTGLPVGDFNQATKTRLRQMLLGDHRIRREGKHDRHFVVTGVYVVPQAMGSLYYLVLDRQGRLVDGDLADSQVGIIDIGTLTTNYILCDRLRYVETGSDSIKTGIAEALRKIAKDLRDAYGLDWTQRLNKVDQAMRAGRVEIQGRPIDITEQVQPHIDAIADTIISHTRTLWGAGIELKAVVVSGGGSQKLAPYIAREYPHMRTVGKDPQFANVSGYLRIGLRRFG